jgi:dihydroflavonol-4-reductase
MLTITGATGHLGQSLLRQISSRGDQVNVTTRPQSDRNLLEGYCNRIFNAPLEDTRALREAFENTDTVIHTAALIDIRRGNLKAMTEVNVRGTENVINACRQAGVKRLVYVSSIEAINLQARRRPIREDFGFARGNAVMEYGETKADASRLVTAAGLSGELETVLICPTGIIGPWDYKGGIFTKMIKQFLAGRIPATIPGGFDFVDVRDVAGAVLAAVEKGRSGETYITSGNYLKISELLGILEKAGSVYNRRMNLPLWLARTAGNFSELWSRTTGSEVLFTRGSIEILQTNALIDSAKAAEELGYRSRPSEETLRDTVNWMVHGAAVNPEPAFI